MDRDLVTAVPADTERILFAGGIGLERWERRRFTADRYGAGAAARVGNDVLGAVGEYAAATVLGVVWDPGIEPDGDGDLGPGRYVRTAPRAGADLLVRPKDPAGRHLLVRWPGLGQALEVVGWIDAADAKQRRYWNPRLPDPAYCVPAGELLPLETFL